MPIPPPTRSRPGRGVPATRREAQGMRDARHSGRSHRGGRRDPRPRHRRRRSRATYLRRRVTAVLAMAALVVLAVEGVKAVTGTNAPVADGGSPQAESGGGAAGLQEAPVDAATTSVGAPDHVRSGQVDKDLPLGPETISTVPTSADQVVIVRGDAPRSSTATVELYERDDGWQLVGSWDGHVGKRGWTTDHREGDLQTPVGTFTITDAGGRRPDPGTKLPYHRSSAFVATPDPGFGDSVKTAFDYVVAIDFNRVRGRSPLDPARPDGWSKGGGIWLHIDHNGPTHGCVSIPQSGMETLLLTLAPTENPVVVMGDTSRLST